VHELFDLAQDMRLSWSEGWANYLSGAIKEWLVLNHPERLSVDTTLSPSGSSAATSLYVDTFGTVAFSYDFRSGSFFGTPLLYATNEGAVAKILWGINDELLFGLPTLWEVFSGPLATPTVTANLEGVWDGWLQLTSADDEIKGTMRTILRDREVYYEEDGSEVDNSTAQATPLRDGRYTLFSSDGQGEEFDVVLFSVLHGHRYRIETHNLHNGADTFLRILDSSGNVVATNDDYAIVDNVPPSPNDTCRFSSRIEFTAPADGIYHAEISSSPAERAQTGRYGDYQLAIKEDEAFACP
jgi:hypothetical protein